MSLRTVPACVAVSLLVAVFTATGCGSGEPPTLAQQADQPPKSASSASASTAAEPTAPADDRTAEEVFEDLSDSIDGLSLTLVYDEDSDPNKLLGRPNGYSSKVAFADDRVKLDEFAAESLANDAIERGGSVEVFPDASGAQARADYIQGVLKSAGGLGSEYDYVKGPVLVRVTGDLVPSKARDYEAALG
jgi:hypothetical protein